MNRSSRNLFVSLSILALSCTATPLSPLAWADDPYYQGPPNAYPSSPYPEQPPGYHPPRPYPPAELMIFDGLVVRPLMLGTTLVGAGLFIVTLPFSLLGGNVDQAADRLVAEPARWVFDNCLGCLPPRAYGSEYPDPQMP